MSLPDHLRRCRYTSMATCESAEPAVFTVQRPSITELYEALSRDDRRASRAPDARSSPPEPCALRALLIRLTQPGAARLEMRSSGCRGARDRRRASPGSGFRSRDGASPLASADREPCVRRRAGCAAATVRARRSRIVRERSRPVERRAAAVRVGAFVAVLRHARASRALPALCFPVSIASFVVSGSILRKLNPWILGLVCFGCCLLDLAILFSPYGAHDLRLFYLSGPLQEEARLEPERRAVAGVSVAAG